MNARLRGAKLLSAARRPWVIAAAVSAIALAPRWDWALTEHPLRFHVIYDMEIYLNRGLELFSHRPRPEETFTPVGYPAFLHLLVRSATDNLESLAKAQAALSAVTAGLGSLFARRLDRSSMTQLVAGLAIAGYFPLTLYTGFVLTETLFAFLLVAGVLALANALDPKSSRPLLAAAGAGMLFGAGVLVRPALLFLPLALAGIAFFSSPLARRSIGTAAAVLALTIAPVCVLNSIALGRPALVASNGGVNFFLAHSECHAARTNGPGTILVTTHFNRNHFTEDCWFEAPFHDESVFYRAGLRELAAHPSRLVRAFRGLGEGLGLGPRRPWPDLPYWPGSKKHQEPINDFSHAFFWALFLPAAVHGGVRLRSAYRERRVDPTAPRAIGWAVIATVLVALYLYNGNPRVRVSSDPIMIALAAAAWLAPLRWLLGAANRRGTFRKSSPRAAGIVDTIAAATDDPPRRQNQSS